MASKSTLNAIIRYYREPKRPSAQLSAKQEEIRLRLLSIYALIRDRVSPTRAVEQHQEVYDISHAVAWRDYRSAIRLFGNIQKSEKEGLRALVLEWSIDMLDAARKEGDLKNADRAIGRIIQASGLENEDADLPNFEKLEPSAIVIGLPPGLEKRLAGLLTGGAVNLSRSANLLAEDAQIVHAEEDEEE